MQKTTLWKTSASSTVNATRFQNTDCINDIEYLLLASVFCTHLVFLITEENSFWNQAVVFLLHSELT